METGCTDYREKRLREIEKRGDSLSAFTRKRYMDKLDRSRQLHMTKAQFHTACLVSGAFKFMKTPKGNAKSEKAALRDTRSLAESSIARMEELEAAMVQMGKVETDKEARELLISLDLME